MTFTVNKKAFCVLEFAKTESIVTVQRRFQIMYHTEPPTDKTIREWYMNCFVCRWFCVVHDPKPRCTVTIDSVLANSKTQNAFLFTVNAIFIHDYPLAVEPGSTPRPLVQKKTWRDSVPIDMLLSAVSVLVVAQSSSEIPEGLRNNPVYTYIQMPICRECNQKIVVFSDRWNFTPFYHSHSVSRRRILFV